MAGVARLFELWCDDEVSFCENAESPSSNSSWERRLPCLSYTITTSQERIRDGGLVSRMNDEELSHLGPREATLEFTTYIPGHLTTTAGSLTETWAQQLLGDGLGGAQTSFAGTTVSAATSATSITFTSTSNLAAGDIVRVGVKGDGGGDGQAAVIGSVAAPVTLLTALPAEPADAAVIYATQLAHHDESTAHTLTTKRWMCGFTSSPTTGAQYQLMGAQLAGFVDTYPLSSNALPTRTWTYWQRNAETIPSSSLSLEAQYAAPCSGGSMFLQATGTTTRATVTPAEMTLTVDLGLEPIYGPGGAGTYQNIIGWVRSACKPTLNMSIPFTTAQETLFDAANQSYVYRHILFTANAIDGRSIGWYMPRAFHVGNRPSQPVMVNNQLYTNVTLVGRESTTTTTERTRSAIRFFAG
jgi:hypothetical protein